MRSLLATLILSLGLMLPQPSSAQNSSDTAENALQLIKSQKNPVVIDSLSLARYESALIPELANSIAEHDLVVSTLAQAPANFKLDNAWINASLKGGTRKLENLTAIPNQDNPRGPAFGSFEEIKEEAEAAIIARKLLWNVVSLLESNRFVDLTLKLSWSNQAALKSDNLAARLVVAYPGVLKSGQAIAMREKLTITEPAWLSSFSLLTLRQYGANEDLIWYFSPTLLSTRELAGSLRGDPLFQSLFSLDDLLVFSAKPELLEPSASAIFETLMPFVLPKQVITSSTSTDSSCQAITNPAQDSNNPMGSLYLSPRSVFTLELKQRDPFSLVGRQKLYVDAATMIPFFREEYAQNGELIKSVLAAFSLVSTPGSDSTAQPETHIIPHTVIAFGKSGKISIAKTISGRICNSIPKDIDAKFFDPSQLDAGHKKVAVAGAKHAETAAK